MSDSLEDLLAQLRTEHQSAAIAGQSPEPPVETQPEIKSTGVPMPSPSTPSSPDRLGTRSPTDLNQLLAELDQLRASPPTPHCLPSTPHSPDSTDRLLAELKTFHLEQNHQAELAAQLEQERQQAAAEHQRATEQRHQETLVRQQRAAQIRRAKAWLQQLDPHGGEGVWFEEFATKYDSRLEAAIDYLGAVETGK